MIIVLMGVAGSGKSTVGQLLASDLGWRFIDADDFHPAANRAKMASGRPLDDGDRAPWLAALRTELEALAGSATPAVLACSALKARYRDTLQVATADVRWVHLHGAPALLQARLAQRTGHFLRPELLASQLATLEPPAAALALDVAAPPAELVARIRQAFAV